MVKFIVVAFVLCVYASLARGYLDESALNDDLRDLIATLHKQCITETGIDNSIVQKTNDGEFPDDQKLKCYMKCILAEGGAMDENGNLDFTAVEEIIPDKLRPGIEHMFNTCVPQAKNADLCEKSFEFYTCCYKTDSKAYFLI